MKELKFSCPDCGQHIAADSGWSGVQVSCPACASVLVVPKQALLKSSRRLSKLCVASLVLCLSGIGTIPGLVCGHLARRRIKRDPTLKGNRIALAGLIIGYAGLIFAAVLLVAANWLLPQQRAQTLFRPPEPVAVPPNSKGMEGEHTPVAGADPVEAEFLALKGSPGWETISFRVSNLASKQITELTLRYTFRDAQGQALRQTQMVKQIEPPLGANETQELLGGAFPHPQTKSVDVIVIGATFRDGTRWQREL